MTYQAKTVGVIVTTYNNEATIGSCIQSILNQSKLPDEIIISDNGSVDGTIGIVKRFVAEHKFIKLKHFDLKKSAAANRDFGIRNCNCDIVTHIDADDIMNKTKLECESRLINEKFDVAFSDIFVLGQGMFDTRYYDLKAFAFIANFFRCRKFIIASRLLGVPRDLMFFKSLYVECGGFDLSFKFYEDLDLKFRLFNIPNVNLVHNKHVGTVYVQHQFSLSKTDDTRKVEDLINVFAKNGVNIRSDGFWIVVRKVFSFFGYMCSFLKTLGFNKDLAKMVSNL